MATSYGIVQQSGGHIEVQSQLEQGTTFKIFFPSTRSAVDEVREEAEPHLAIQGAETVLLVEDETLVRDMVSLMLREQGYQVLEANNGQEALRVLGNQEGREPGFMLTDVVMPLTGGVELAERVRATIPDMNILFTSGYMDGTQDQEKMSGPGMDFIAKPFSIESIGAKVRQLLD